MNRIAIVIALALGTLCSSADSFAQYSLDAVTKEMEANGLFHPHANNCTTSEAFVALGSGGTSGNTGICIEKTTRTATGWETARQTCAGLGKRLPEPAEWKVACDNAGSLSISSMGSAWEYASNYSFTHFIGGGSGTLTNREVHVSGNGGCNYNYVDIVGSDTGNAFSCVYRCVH